MANIQLDTPHSLDYGTGRRRSTWHTTALVLTFGPIVIATILSIYASLHSMEFRLLMKYPQTPWETSIVADAWRFAHHLPIFEQLPNGHATHLYGPLTSITLGLIFKLTHSTNLIAGRALTMTCSLLASAIILWTFSPRKHPLLLLIGAGLLIALNYRARAYFVETRPDMIALLLATIGLTLCYYAHRSIVPALYLPASMLIVTALLFKQTYVAAAGVPIAAVILTTDYERFHARTFFGNLLLASLPLIACAATIVLLKFYAPNAYFYMIGVPRLVEIRPDYFGYGAISMLTLSPLFVAMLIWFILMPRDPRMHDSKISWLLAALLVGSAAGLLAFAKRGGSYNSLLLGWVPATAFCIAMLDPLLRRLNSLRDGFYGIAGGWLIAFLISITTFSVPQSDVCNFNYAHGSADYNAVIGAVKKIDGNVICPEDPTILIMAKNEPGRCLEVELDALGRPGAIPPGLADDIADADWFIRVHGNYDGFFTPEMMKELGFERQPNSPHFRKIYSLWKRIADPTPQATTAPSRAKRRIKYKP